jgi:hypothetical protein
VLRITFLALAAALITFPAFRATEGRRAPSVRGRLSPPLRDGYSRRRAHSEVFDGSR